MDAFFVELIAKGKRLELYIDKVPSITIDELVQVSRHLEAQLDEEGSVPEDYTLNVSSPGMSNPLRVREQYVKKELDVSSKSLHIVKSAWRAD